MLLRLRDQTVQNAKSITDLIYYMYDDKDDEEIRTNISQHMKQYKGKDTLIILEGLDEFPKDILITDRSSIFTRLLSRKVLPDATLLITSRPSATVELQKVWEISRHIEILGFTEKDITDYIQCALSPQELPAFDRYLSTHPSIRLTMYIPLNCASVVEVYKSCQKSNHHLPTTTTDLYTCLVQTTLLRYLDSDPNYKSEESDVDKFTDLPPSIYHYFYQLSEMAYHGVQSQQLTFYNQRNAIEHLGFMNTVTELFPAKHSIRYSYNFLHLSVQEYLAAYFVSLKSMDVQQQLLQTMCTEQHLRNMGIFLAGITKFEGMDRTIVKAIIENECEKEGESSLRLSTYALQLLHESGDYSTINGYSMYSCTLTDYDPLLDFFILGHCIASSSYKWRLRLGDTGQYMISTARIAMLVQTLKSQCKPCYTIEWITCCYETSECVQHLLLELPQYVLQQVQKLLLVSNRKNPQPLTLCTLEQILTKMSRLETLWLYNGAISTSGAIAIADIVKYNNTLQLIHLGDNNISSEGIKALQEVKKDIKLYY